MPNTTYYNFPTPADTDLVKDGASAIRSLGNAVDTTTKALNPSTTLGDIEYRSSTANTNTRLAIGTTGQILTVAGGVPSWATAASAGGITQLATGSLSGVSTVTISSISQSYKHLFAVVQNAQGASNGTTNFRPNNVSTASSYKTVYNYLDQVTWYTGSFTSFTNRTDVTSDANEMTFFEIPNYTLTGYKLNKLTHAGATSVRSTFLYGRNDDTAAVTSLVILNGDGVNFSSGTYTLYGVS